MFKDKEVVITGGARVIGQVMVQAFRDEGAQVCVMNKLPNEYFVGDLAEEEAIKIKGADMSKTLIITEKPSVARDIAAVMMNRPKKSDGYLEDDTYIITWAVGHLLQLAEPAAYHEKYRKWQMASLPVIPKNYIFTLEPIPRNMSVLSVVAAQIKRKDVSTIVWATDSAREGHLIAVNLAAHLKVNKPSKRLWLSSLTPEAIKKGLQEVKPMSAYENLADSAIARSQADWVIGMSATRAFTLAGRTGSGYTEKSGVVSVGRVQTPTLAFTVNRQKEIDAFVRVDYFEVKADHGNFTSLWWSLKEQTHRIKTLETAEVIAQKTKGQPGVIQAIKKEKKSTPPPFLYDLTSLQRDANRKLGFSAKRTLAAAQALYEKHKYITYPRTDSNRLTEDMKETVFQTLNKMSIPVYKPLIDSFVDSLKFTKRTIDDSKVSDHHALIPTPKMPVLEKLNEDERKIYDMIARRFIAAFMPTHEYETTKALIICQHEAFVCKGRVVVLEGWKEAYVKETSEGDGKEKEDQKLPTFVKGQDVIFQNTEVLNKKTQAPKPYTEDTLLAAMENAGKSIDDEELRDQMKEFGIGTPATRAEIIERIIQVGYVERQKKYLMPTPKGMATIEALPDEITSVDTAGKFERALNRIARGEYPKEKFDQGIIRFAHALVEKAKVYARSDIKKIGQVVAETRQIEK
ncbi:DNA topoisomerase 3 [Anoxynatronum buryatiense]|uniref:DNA topoisomerase n=1 Tax=Anoxynatronum buryatiense TaxID=489973 RepID=A0AA46AKL8_9CLOT|nr:DNA topoisomerase 3 [Anoxynatronum buryatiense]SMP71089.1 DNA topoisomerase-3 [Anoxynatronum buryatiense]